MAAASTYGARRPPAPCSGSTFREPRGGSGGGGGDGSDPSSRAWQDPAGGRPGAGPGGGEGYARGAWIRGDHRRRRPGRDYAVLLPVEGDRPGRSRHDHAEHVGRGLLSPDEGDQPEGPRRPFVGVFDGRDDPGRDERGGPRVHPETVPVGGTLPRGGSGGGNVPVAPPCFCCRQAP